MGKDWQAVATAIDARLGDLEMTQAELAHRAGVALETVRELQHNLVQRRRNQRTLSAISVALGWPPDHLARIAGGEDPNDPDANDPLLRELNTIKETLTGITSRLDAIERQLADGDAKSGAEPRGRAEPR